MGRAKIDMYIDCVSPYSYCGYVHIKRNEQLLQSHGVDVEIIPFFLGGINHGSGNKPPWTLPAKAVMSKYDMARAQKYFDLPNLRTPDVFPILSLLPQRCLCYIKENFPKDKFDAAFAENFKGLWEQNLDIGKPEPMMDVLRRNFTAQQVEDIMKAASSAPIKQVLNNNTEAALKQGAYGAPWFWVRNSEGKEEPFFGSDRFHFMWEYLGLPWSDIQLGGQEAKL